MSPDKKVAIGVSSAAAFVFAAPSCPRDETRGTPGVRSPFGDRSPFGGMPITLTITGWSGSVTPGGLKPPNWLAVLAAACVAAAGWLRAPGVWTAPSFVPLAFAGYGLLHARLALVALSGSSQGSAGVGSFLTALAVVGMLVVLARQPRSPAHADAAPP